MKSVVSAQTELQKRNLEKDWVLAGLRRNGMLAYQPDYKSGQLCAPSDKKLQSFKMNSARLRPEWLLRRYEWVDESKAPLEPDYSLIAGAMAVADLLEWSYYNPVEDTEDKSEDSATLMNVSELPEEFQLPCIQSGVLTLSLDL